MKTQEAESIEAAMARAETLLPIYRKLQTLRRSLDSYDARTRRIRAQLVDEITDTELEFEEAGGRERDCATHPAVAKTHTLAIAAIALLLSGSLLPGCASMHGCDVSVGVAGPRVHCDPPPPPPPAQTKGGAS